MRNTHESYNVYTRSTKSICQFFTTSYLYRANDKQILKLSSLTKDECIADAHLRHTQPKIWVSKNLQRITSWLKEHGIDRCPKAPLTCGWVCLFNPDEETKMVLSKAKNCRRFNIDDTTYPSLEYKEDEPGTRLEPKAFWLMELRRSLLHLCNSIDKVDPAVVSFYESLEGETNRVMETIK